MDDSQRCEGVCWSLFGYCHLWTPLAHVTDAILITEVNDLHAIEKSEGRYRWTCTGPLEIWLNDVTCSDPLIKVDAAAKGEV